MQQDPYDMIMCIDRSQLLDCKCTPSRQLQSNQGTSQYQGFGEAGTNVGNSYMGNEVYQLNPVIDYAEYKNIDQYTKPTENMVTQVHNEGYSEFNSSGSKVISAVYRPNATNASLGRLVGMQTNNFVVQAGRYYKLQLLLKLSSGQAPDIDVCTFRPSTHYSH